MRREYDASKMSTIIDQAESLRFALGGSTEFGWPASNPRAMNRLAEGLGHEVAKSAHASDPKEALTALALFWEENDLGQVTFHMGRQVLIRMKHCYDCLGWRYGFTSIPCTFKSTLFRAALTDMLGLNVRVTELECCRNGGQGCTFTVTGMARP